MVHKAGFDALIDFCLSEIALCGAHGATSADFKRFIYKFYEDPENNVSKDGLAPVLKANFDDKFFETVWSWVVDHADVRILLDEKPVKLSLSEFEALEVPDEIPQPSTAADQPSVAELSGPRVAATPPDPAQLSFLWGLHQSLVDEDVGAQLALSSKPSLVTAALPDYGPSASASLRSYRPEQLQQVLGHEGQTDQLTASNPKPSIPPSASVEPSLGEHVRRSMSEGGRANETTDREPYPSSLDRAADAAVQEALLSTTPSSNDSGPRASSMNADLVSSPDVRVPTVDTEASPVGTIESQRHTPTASVQATSRDPSNTLEQSIDVSQTTVNKENKQQSKSAPLRAVRSFQAVGTTPTADSNPVFPLPGIQCKSPRLFASQERTWQAVAGHSIDYTKITHMEFTLLSIIASRGPEGILQPELRELSGQDKRSVPKRTDDLAKKGYIEKRGVSTVKTRTSICIHRRFVKNSVLSEGSKNPTDANTVMVGKALVLENFVRFLYSTLKESRIITVQDIRAKLGVTAKVFGSKTISRTLRRLEETGFIQRVRARQKGSRAVWLICIKLLRAPNDEDVKSLSFRRRTVLVNDNEDEDYGFDEDNQGDDVMRDLELEVEMDGQNEPETTENENKLATTDSFRMPPGWTPDRQLAHVIFNGIYSTGKDGADSRIIRSLTMGNFWKRPLEAVMSRLTDNWEKSQPRHLRHLAVVRDTAVTAEQRFIHYLYRTYENYQEAVDAGEASWEAVSTEAVKKIAGKIKGRPKKSSDKDDSDDDLDEFGFPKIPTQQFLKADGTSTLQETHDSLETRRRSTKYWDKRLLQSLGMSRDSKPANDKGSLAARVKRSYNRRPKSDLPVRRPKRIVQPKLPLLSAEQRVALGLPAKGRLKKSVEVLIKKQLAAAKQAQDHTTSGAGNSDITESSATPDWIDLEGLRGQLQNAANRENAARPAKPLKETTDDSKGENSPAKASPFPSPMPGEFVLPSIEGLEGVSIPAKLLMPATKARRTPGVAPRRLENYPASQRKKVRAVTEQFNQRSEPGVYTNPYMQRTAGQGRPRNAFIAVFKSDRLKEFEWFKELSSPEPDIPVFSYPRRTTKILPTPVKETPESEAEPSGVTRRQTRRKSKKVTFADIITPPQATASTDGNVGPAPQAPQDILDASTQPPNTATSSRTVEQACQPLQDTLEPSNRLSAPPVRQNLDRNANAQSPDTASTRGNVDTDTSLEVRNPASMSEDVDPPVRQGTSDGVPLPETASMIQNLDSKSLQVHSNASLTASRIADVRPEMGKVVTPKQVAVPRKKIVEPISARGVTLAKGYVNFLRVEIITTILSRCGGVFPGNGEIRMPFNTLWAQRSSKYAEPDRGTLKQTIKNLIDTGKLLSLSFTSESPQGHTYRKNLLTLPEVDPASDVVNDMKKKMQEAHPKEYYPEEIRDLVQDVTHSFTWSKAPTETDLEVEPLYPVEQRLDDRVAATTRARKEAQDERQAKAREARQSQNAGQHKGRLKKATRLDTLNVAPSGIDDAEFEDSPATPKNRWRSAASPASSSDTDDEAVEERLRELAAGHRRFIPDPAVIALRKSMNNGTPVYGDLSDSDTDHMEVETHESRVPSAASKSSGHHRMPIATPTLDDTSDEPPRKRIAISPSSPGLSVTVYKRKPLPSSFEYFEEHNKLVDDNDGWVHLGPWSFDRDYDKTDITSMTDPGIRFHASSGTYSTEFIVTRSARAHLWGQQLMLNLEEVEAEGLGQKPEEMLHNKRAQGLMADPAHNQFLVDVNNIAAWEEQFITADKNFLNWQVKDPFINLTYTGEQALAPPSGERRNPGWWWILNSNASSKPFTILPDGNVSKVQHTPHTGKVPTLKRPAITDEPTDTISESPPKKKRRAGRRKELPKGPLVEENSNEDVADREKAKQEAEEQRKRAHDEFMRKEELRKETERRLLNPTVTERLTGLTGDPANVIKRKSNTALPKEIRKEGTHTSGKKKVPVNVPEHDKFKRLLYTLIVAASMGGGEVDWNIVTSIYRGHASFNLEKTKKLWAFAQKEMGPQVDAVTAEFEEKFVEAYTAEKVPAMDGDMANYDWSKVIEWALENCKFPQASLPADPALLRDWKVTESSYERFDREDWHKINLAQYLKEQRIAAYSYAVPLHDKPKKPEPFEENALRARSWIRSNCATPETFYNGKGAHDKLATLGEDTISEVLTKFVDDKVLRPRKGKRFLPGRNFDFTSMSARAFKRTLEPQDFLDAVAFKKELDTAFRKPDPSLRWVEIQQNTKDGAVLAIENLLASGRIKLIPKLPPVNSEFGAPLPRLSVWGFIERDYRTKYLDRSRMHWPLEVVPTETYTFGNGLKPQFAPQTYTEWPTLPEPPRQDPTDPFALVPIWITIDGSTLIWQWWYRVLNVVLQGVAFQSGTNISDISKLAKHSIEEFEVELVLTWLERLGAVGRTAGGGYVVKEFWWCVFGDALKGTEQLEAEGEHSGFGAVIRRKPVPMKEGYSGVRKRIRKKKEKKVKVPDVVNAEEMDTLTGGGRKRKGNWKGKAKTVTFAEEEVVATETVSPETVHAAGDEMDIDAEGEVDDEVMDTAA